VFLVVWLGGSLDLGVLISFLVPGLVSRRIPLGVFGARSFPFLRGGAREFCVSLSLLFEWTRGFAVAPFRISLSSLVYTAPTRVNVTFLSSSDRSLRLFPSPTRTHLHRSERHIRVSASFPQPQNDLSYVSCPDFLFLVPGRGTPRSTFPPGVAFAS